MSKEKEYIFKIKTESDDKGLKKVDEQAKKTSKSLDETEKKAKKTGKSLDETGKKANKSGGLFNKMGSKINGASKDIGGFKNMMSVLPKVIGSAISSVLSFTAALLANPIGIIIAAATALIGLLGLVLSKFQPFVDFISDKMAFVKGLINGFISSLQTMGNVIKSVFSGNFKEAGDLISEMGEKTLETAKAQEELNKALREYDIQQKLNDATTAESLKKQKELREIYKNQGKNIEERKNAFNAYYKERKAEALDDYNAQKKVYDAEFKLINKKYNLELKTATEIKKARTEGKITQEEYIHLLDVVIKTKQQEAKVQEVSTNKAQEENTIRKQGLSEQLSYLKIRTTLYEAQNKTIIKKGKKLTEEMLNEEAKRLNNIARKKRIAAEKEYEIVLKNYDKNSDKAKEAELKKATEIININDKMNEQLINNQDLYNKQLIDESILTLNLWVAENKDILKDTTITTQKELSERLKYHKDFKDKSIDIIKEKAKIEKWSETKLKLELLKINNTYIEKSKSLSKNLIKNQENVNKEELKNKKELLKFLNDIDEKYLKTEKATGQDLLDFKTDQAVSEYEINLEKLKKLKLSEDDYNTEKEKLQYILNDNLKKINDEYVLSENERNISENEKNLELLKNYLSAAQELSNSFIEYNNTERDIELEKIKNFYDKKSNLANDDYKHEKDLLDEQYKNGLINKEQYDKKMIKLKETFDANQKVLDDQRAKQEDDIKRDAYEKNKKYEIANVIMNTAQAIMGVWAAYSEIPGGVIISGALSAIIGALGVAQISKINATEYADGGKLFGDFHAQSSGGIQITPNVLAEGGEYIINRAATKKYEPLLDTINGTGNGKGDTSTVGEIIDYEKLAGLINDKKVYVVSSDITDQQKEDERIVEIST